MGKRTLIQMLFPCLRLYWFLLRPQTFGVQCVIRHGDDLLLVRNTYGRKQWTFPGGGISRGETNEEAIRREVREEVGLHLQALRHLGAFEAIIDYKRDHIAVYTGISPDRRITIDTAEILEARWFRPQHLPPLGPSAVRVLAMWREAQR